MTKKHKKTNKTEKAKRQRQEIDDFAYKVKDLAEGIISMASLLFLLTLIRRAPSLLPAKMVTIQRRVCNVWQRRPSYQLLKNVSLIATNLRKLSIA